MLENVFLLQFQVAPKATRAWGADAVDLGVTWESSACIIRRIREIIRFIKPENTSMNENRNNKNSQSNMKNKQHQKKRIHRNTKNKNDNHKQSPSPVLPPSQPTLGSRVRLT